MFSSFPVEYTSTPIYRDGQLAEVVVVFKDITQRKSAERELLEAYAEVARMKERLEAETFTCKKEINVRVIAATNRDLKADAEAKLLREDLYFRLNVFPVEVVPLRERISDILLLAAHFVALICKRT